MKGGKTAINRGTPAYADGTEQDGKRGKREGFETRGFRDAEYARSEGVATKTRIDHEERMATADVFDYRTHDRKAHARQRLQPHPRGGNSNIFRRRRAI